MNKIPSVDAAIRHATESIGAVHKLGSGWVFNTFDEQANAYRTSLPQGFVRAIHAHRSSMALRAVRWMASEAGVPSKRDPVTDMSPADEYAELAMRRVDEGYSLRQVLINVRKEIANHMNDQ
jgi:hypothetical protein